MKLLLFIFAFVLLYIAGIAQEDPKLQQNHLADTSKHSTTTINYKYNIGLGLGMDYGGFGGIKFTYIIVPRASVFAAGGYALIGFGYNFGVTIRSLPEKKVCPYLSVMYGYNGIIQITGASQYDKIYYGPSFNLGLEFRSKKLKNYFNAEILIPIRPQEFYTDLDALKKNPLIKISSEPPPIGISLGYHFVF